MAAELTAAGARERRESRGARGTRYRRDGRYLFVLMPLWWSRGCKNTRQ